MMFWFDILENDDTVFHYLANYSTLVAVNLFLHISKHCHHCTFAQYHTGEVLTLHCLTSMGKFFDLHLLKF